ncbi:MAG: hypothetical protein Q4G63_10320 [Bacteroidia bacterium]|nr:hypothetical protein [Bacteroidia bacterium]
METITIIPNSKRQSKIIKALLEEMKVRFTTVEEKKVKISKAAKESIIEGLKAAENDDFLPKKKQKNYFMTQYIKWTKPATRRKIEILKYWTKHNGSPTYSAKIERESDKTEILILENPFIGAELKILMVLGAL